MKPEPFKLKGVYKTLCCLLFIIGIIANSCRKDYTPGTPDYTPPGGLSINQARSWFQLYSTSKRSHSTDSLSQLYSNFLPVWDYAQAAEDSNYYVVEALTNYQSPLGFIMGDAAPQTLDTSAIHSLTRLLVLRDKSDDEMLAALMHITGSSTAQVNAVHYGSVPAGFSGTVLYTTTEGVFVNGFTYTNGQITHIAKPANGGQAVARKRTDGLKTHLAQQCTIEPVAVYSRTCTDIVFPDGIVYTQSCTPWRFEGYAYVENCTDDGTGGGGGYGTTTPPPCPGTTVSAANSSGKRISLADTTNSGSPCQVPQPQPQEEIVDSALAAMYPCVVKLIIEKLHQIQAYKNFVDPFKLPNVGHSLTWSSTGNLPWGGSYQLGVTTGINGDSYIRLNENAINNSSKLILAASSIHETLHAYLNLYLESNKGGNYSPGNTWAVSLYDYFGLQQTNYTNEEYLQHTSLLIKNNFDMMVNILAEYDNNQNTLDTYRKLMLYGLNNPGINANDLEVYINQAAFQRIAQFYGIDISQLNAFYQSHVLSAPGGKLPANCNTLNNNPQ